MKYKYIIQLILAYLGGLKISRECLKREIPAILGLPTFIIYILVILLIGSKLNKGDIT